MRVFLLHHGYDGNKEKSSAEQTRPVTRYALRGVTYSRSTYSRVVWFPLIHSRERERRPMIH